MAKSKKQKRAAADRPKNDDNHSSKSGAITSDEVSEPPRSLHLPKKRIAILAIASVAFAVFTAFLIYVAYKVMTSVA